MRSEEADVLVIGAGVAGLTAAGVLSSSGLEVRIVESRDRIGGRILTVHTPNRLPTELGAEFIHGRPHQIWEIIHAQRWPTHEVDGDEWHSEAGRLQRGGEAFSAIDKIFKRMKDLKSDQTFDEFLRDSCSGCSDDDRQWARQFVSGFHAADPERIGVQWILRSMKADKAIEGDRAFRLLNGYDVLPSHLQKAVAAKLDLHTKVRTVGWRKGRVMATAMRANSDVTYHARAAVVTLPLSILKLSGENYVRFEPEVEEKREAVSKLEMGSAVRIVFDFRTRFWDAIAGDEERTLADMSFLSSQQEFFPTWWSAMPDRSARLTGWTGGLQARRLSNRSAEAVCETAIASLARVLKMEPREIEQQVESWHTHDWDNDPHSFGAYSYAGAGGADAAAALSEPVEQTLFFAGEHCDTTGHNGTVHGAMASGQQAAKQILSAFGRDPTHSGRPCNSGKHLSM
jgi:monoamine oxidase